MLSWEFCPPAFPIQWHITVKCNRKCKHCYTTDPITYKNELEKELYLEDMLKVVNRLIEFRTKYKVPVSVAITGGDPFFKKGHKTLLKELYKKDFPIQILGNPSNSIEQVDLLKEVNIRGYQLSLDGLKKYHDEVRGKGSFDETIKSIDFLNSYNIPVHIMFTLSKFNSKDLKPLMTLCAKMNVSRFSFDRLVPLGRAKNWHSLFSPEEYKNFLFNTFQHQINLRKKGLLTRYAFKDRLWRLLFYDLKIFKPRKTSKIISGCLVGVTGLAILADGSVLPCRRLPVKIGQLPEQSIEEIFFSREMNELRSFESIKNCSECELLPYCRGNRCVAYSTYGDYFAPDPQCWRFEE